MANRFAKKQATRPTGRGLAAIEHAQVQKVEADAKDQSLEKQKARAQKSADRKARQFSCYIDPDLKAEIRAACGQLPPDALGGGLSPLVERALRAELDRLREAHNAGQPFEVRPGDSPSRGRPTAS